MTPPAEEPMPDSPSGAEAAAPGPRPDRRRVRGRGEDPGPGAQPPGAGALRRHVERALLLQVVPHAPQAAADRGPAGAGRARGERRGDRRRGRHRRRHPHREPQPSLGDRALPGGGDRGGGILRDIFTMGARPLAVMDPLFFGPPDDARQRWLLEGVVSGISGYGNSVGVPTVGRRADLRPLLRPEPVGQRAVHGRAARRAAGARHRVGPGQPGRAARQQHRARRHRRGQRAGLGRLRRRRRHGAARRHQAAERAGGRPLRGEAPHRGLPRAAGQEARGGDSGPGWGRPGLCHQRDGRPGRRRHGRRRLRRASARGRHGALGGDDQREPGAHAGHRHARSRGPRWRRSAPSGRCGPPSSARSPRPIRRRAAGCASATASTGPMLADVPAASLSDDAPLYDRPRQAPGRRLPRRAPPRPTTAPADLLAPAALAPLGLPPVRPPALLEHGRRARAATPRSCAWPVPACPPPARGGGDAPTPIPAPARSTPARGTALTLAEGVANLACVGRDAGGRGQLPELRQPRAPRGHVAALGVHRRDGGGLPRPRRSRSSAATSASTTRAGGRHRPDAGARPARPGRGGARRAPGLAWQDGDTLVLLGARSGGRTGRSPWTGRAGPPSAGGTGPGRSPPSTSRPRGRCALRGRVWWQRIVAGAEGDRALVHAVHDVSCGGLAVALAEMAVAAGTGCAVDARRCRRAVHRVAVALRGGHHRARRAAAPGPPALGVPASVLGRAGGDRFTLGDSGRPPAGGRCARPTRAIWPVALGES